MKSLANWVSMLRIGFIPLVLYFLLADFFLMAAVFICVSAFSDILDGYLARRFHQVTKLGILLDPIADKLMMMVVAAFFVTLRELPVWYVLILFYKDFSLLTGMFALLFYQKEAIVSSQAVGKLSAALNFMLLFFICLSQVTVTTRFVIHPLLILSSVFIVLSFLSYSKRWFGLFGGAVE